MIKALKILETLAPLQVNSMKIHLATSNGRDDPLDVYLAGNFPEWQRWQTKRNFEQDYVLSLIKFSGNNRWLFAGVYRTKGHETRPAENRTLFYYELERLEEFSELEGRLIVGFQRTSRQSYLHADRWMDDMHVEEILPKRHSLADFPGFRKIDISKGELDLIVSQSLETWRTALSNIAGVYLISDTKSGKLYVGSATGAGGIWQRWCNYSSGSHGGNKEIIELLDREGPQHANFFRFSVLELADLHDSKEEVLSREGHWKRLLLSRTHGLNRN
jgi:hypothetical protein